MTWVEGREADGDLPCIGLPQVVTRSGAGVQDLRAGSARVGAAGVGRPGTINVPRATRGRRARTGCLPRPLTDSGVLSTCRRSRQVASLWSPLSGFVYSKRYPGTAGIRLEHRRPAHRSMEPMGRAQFFSRWPADRGRTAQDMGKSCDGVNPYAFLGGMITDRARVSGRPAVRGRLGADARGRWGTVGATGEGN